MDPIGWPALVVSNKQTVNQVYNYLWSDLQGGKGCSWGKLVFSKRVENFWGIYLLVKYCVCLIYIKPFVRVFRIIIYQKCSKVAQTQNRNWAQELQKINSLWLMNSTSSYKWLKHSTKSIQNVGKESVIKEVLQQCSTLHAMFITISVNIKNTLYIFNHIPHLKSISWLV